MEYKVKYDPSYAMLVVSLGAGERITGEAGAMTYMTPNIDVRTRRREKSILGTIGVSLFGGQSLFVNDYVAQGGPGEIALAAGPVGDVNVMRVEPGRGFIVQKAAYLASTEDVDLDVKWEGFTKGLFGQGIFMVRVTGRGDLFINTFGAIDKHELELGEELVVDNFHLVAFSDSCDYKVQRIGGWKETILSGEGFITRIKGPGEVYLQTKNLREFVEWLWTLMHTRVRSSSR
ncbi:MAG: TIGR00266 family protein [Candidatus Bathyarchaeota archaeon]|jgi:uncharacterized protein (TIGR00266 family)